MYNPLPMRTTVIKKLLRLIFYFLPLIAFIANNTAPRAEISMPQGAQKNPLPVKVTIYNSRRTQLAIQTRGPADPLKLQSGRANVQQVKAYVRTEAVEYGVDPFLALWIVKHESSFNPRAKGDGEASRGLWQISKIYHPEVSDAMAFNVASSTEWSLERIRSGKVNEWSTYRNCRTLYADCPF
jgi:Transglycosylase SLT domain